MHPPDTYGAPPPRGSVILVRELEHQLSGSGCCGRLEGDFLPCRGEPVFAERRAIMQAMGPLYRALRERYDDAIDLDVVDPRDLLTVVVLLLRDFRRHQVGVLEALKTLARLPVQAVVVNGRLVARGRWPEPEEVIALLGTTPAARTASVPTPTTQ